MLVNNIIPDAFLFLAAKKQNTMEFDRYFRMYRQKIYHQLTQELFKYDECVIVNVRIVCALGRSEDDDIHVSFFHKIDPVSRKVTIQIMGLGEIRLKDQTEPYFFTINHPDPESIAMFMYECIKKVNS